jgi:hypothetical protein
MPAGILYVTEEIVPNQNSLFNLSFVASGIKYEAIDNLKPDFMTLYKLDSTAVMIPQQIGDARECGIYQFISSRQSTNLGPGPVLVVVAMTLQDVPDAEVELDKWYEEEHISLLSKIPGWLRTRRYKPSAVPAAKLYLALHEYEADNGLGGPEHKAAMATPWRDAVMEKYVENKYRRTFTYKEK